MIIYRAALLPRSETFIAEQAHALTRWQCTLVGESLVKDGVSLDGMDTLVLSGTGLIASFAARLGRKLHLPRLFALRALKRINARLVHVHFGTDAVDIWPTIRVLGLPMLVTLHGYDINIYREWWESGKGGKYRRNYPSRLLQLATEPKVHFIAVSEAIRNRAVAYGIPADKITVRYIGVDTEKFRPSGLPIIQRPKRILFVGRLVEKKGVKYLIRASKIIQELVTNVELVIAGDGPQHKELQQLTANLGVAAKFLGSLTGEQVRQEMQHAQILCLPSVTAGNGDAEGFGLVILEAQACGVPVVTSAEGGGREGIREGMTGAYVTAADEIALAATIAQFLSEPGALKRMAAAAPKFVHENFSLKLCTEELEANYDTWCSVSGTRVGSP